MMSKQETPRSPGSPEPRKASRRSSLATARRLSRASCGAGGGVPLEELLSTIPGPDEGVTAGARLDHLVRLAVSCTARSVSASLEQAEEDELADAARSVAAGLRQAKFPEKVLAGVAASLESGGGGDRPDQLVGEEVRKIRQYTQEIRKESQMWKDLYAERKEMLNKACRNYNAVKAGEIAIQEDEMWKLSEEERNKIIEVDQLILAAKSQLGESDFIIIATRGPFSHQVQTHGLVLCPFISSVE